MGGAPLLLALAVVTVDAGWESDGHDGYRYIIQIPAEQLREVERTGHITSQLPENLRGRVSSVVIRVGDAALPRPDLPPVADSPAADAAAPEEPTDLADVAPLQPYLPSPDETVRAQGDGHGFSVPSMSELRDTGRQAADEIASRARDQLTESARQTADQAANSYGTSRFSGFETQSTSATAPTTSASVQSQNAPSTSRPDPGAPPATAGAAGFPAADAPRDNYWSSGPASSAATDPAPNTAAPNTATPSTAAPNTTAPSTAAPNTAAPGIPTLSTPVARTPAPHAPVANPVAPIADASGASPPSVRGAAPAATTAGNFAPGTTAEARQRLADQRLLEEVGIDASGHAYDKQTNEPLYADDERYPLIVDYVRRMEQASRPKPPTAVDRSSAWGYDTRSGASGFQDSYAPAPAYVPESNVGSYGRTPAGLPAASPRPDSRMASNQTVTPTAQVNPPRQTTGDSGQPIGEGAGEAQHSSPSDSDDTDHSSQSREPSVTAQPLFNFLLLLSIVGNIYLGIAISRLIRRYRNLVSSQRSTAITA